MSIDENSTKRKSLTVHPLGVGNLPTITTPKQQIRQMSEVNLLDYSELDAARIIYPSMRDICTLNTYRELRTKLIQKAGKNNFTVMVSSLAAGGGGSYVSVNLAAAFALDFEKTALLVDCNHTSPCSEKLLSTAVDFGLTDFLVDPGLAVSDIIYATGIPRLRLTPMGNQVSAESEFFTSDRMDEFISEVKSRYAERFTIIDAPPMNSSPDARVLADLCDYSVLVVPYGRVTKAQISAGINSIPTDKFAGLVFNN
jgi:protein-tyrosine kinase